MMARCKLFLLPLALALAIAVLCQNTAKEAKAQPAGDGKDSLATLRKDFETFKKVTNDRLDMLEKQQKDFETFKKVTNDRLDMLEKQQLDLDLNTYDFRFSEFGNKIIKDDQVWYKVKVVDLGKDRKLAAGFAVVIHNLEETKKVRVFDVVQADTVVFLNTRFWDDNNVNLSRDWVVRVCVFTKK